MQSQLDRRVGALVFLLGPGAVVVAIAMVRPVDDAHCALHSTAMHKASDQRRDRLECVGLVGRRQKPCRASTFDRELREQLHELVVGRAVLRWNADLLRGQRVALERPACSRR